MQHPVRLEQYAARPLAVVRRVASLQQLPKVVPDACGVVWNAVKAVPIPGADRHVAVYLDDRINLEVGVELDAPFAGSEDVVGSATPAGPVAATTHYGPYRDLHTAHDAIQQWCRANGHKLAGPCWEVYGHWQDEWNRDPSKIVTDVYYLLAGGG